MVVAEIDEGECCLGFWVKFKIFKVDVVMKDKSIDKREEMDIVSWGQLDGLI